MVKTSMNTNKKKFNLNDGEENIDVYRSLIGSLFYLKNSQPDILHATYFFLKIHAKSIFFLKSHEESKQSSVWGD